MSSLPNLPPIESGDANEARQFAEDRRRLRAGLAQDLTYILGWLWQALAWPFRRIFRLLRRTPDETSNPLD